jgi:hypothetical protein
MANQEVKLTPIDTNTNDIKTLQGKYDELYAKVSQLMDELEEKNQLTDSATGGSKEVVAYSAEVTCDATYNGYVYFRIDDEMTKVDNIYVDVYPVSYRSPVTL